MFSEQDKVQIAKKDISEFKIKEQLSAFQTGFPYLKLYAPASVQKGIMQPNEEEVEQYCQKWKEATAKKDVLKFVPASGAATRMFKDLYGFFDAEYDVPTTPFECQFFERLKDFAFYPSLNQKCIELCGKSTDELVADEQYKQIVHTLLFEEGLNYGQLPKGLLEFHRYGEEQRTPVEEHLVEGARYAQQANGRVRTHFTVSDNHKVLFEQLIAEKAPALEKTFNVHFEVSFSEQKSSTDTLAVTMDNQPFRLDDGSLLFRPGGHGALIENLNDIQADVIFIKNIDNVVPDWFKASTIKYKSLIAGVLVQVQEQVFKYMEKLAAHQYTDEDLQAMKAYLEDTLVCHTDQMLSGEALAQYLFEKFNRPIRVCGMVRNVGEPGGGPFLTYNNDGTVSLQILESSQIDKDDPEKMAMFEKGSYFNPVDLVCAVKNYKSEKFDLRKYVDPKTGFISYKSKNGRELKALELPGLWNGAMSDWNTIFVEVPLDTFNPVKTVNDLLRSQHQEQA